MQGLFSAMGQGDVTSNSWLKNIFQYNFIYSSKPYTDVGVERFQVDLLQCKPKE